MQKTALHNDRPRPERRSTKAIDNDQSDRKRLSKNTRPPARSAEVIIDILSRLSVKNVLQLRCVSKSWRSLIFEPSLIKKHLQRIHMTTRGGNYTNHGVIMSYCQYASFKACSLYSIYNEEEEFDAIDLKYPRPKAQYMYSYREDSIVGSCNGLLCVKLGNEEGVALWNPSIKQFRNLPDSGIRMRVGNYLSQSFVYGVGYDETSDDYKVVAILKILGHAGYAETEVGVYSLRNNSWRRIESFPCAGLPDESVPCSTLVSGSLVWPVLCYTGDPPSNLTWKIVALDLASETHKEILPPIVCDGRFDLTLGEVGGCLGILARHLNTFAEVWVMKEFGMRESWTKLIKLPFRGCMPSYKPLNLSSYGVMFVEDYYCRRLFLCNFKSKQYFPFSPERDKYRNVASCVYIKSLVSPNAEQGLEGNTSES